MRERDRVLILTDSPTPTTVDQNYEEELRGPDWETEANVVAALRSRGYPCRLLGIHDELDLIRQCVAAYQPQIIFNLVEVFKDRGAFDQHIVSLLELQGTPFTGCGSMGMMLCKHKGLSKEILGYHRIRVPQFAVLPPGRKIARSRRLQFPIFIKPLREEASYGIAQASLVETDEQFVQRITFVHEKFQQPAIAEEYIAGRELYVSIIGNHRLRVFPIREIVFREVPPDQPRFASFKAKWDEAYRKRWGIDNRFADDLDPGLHRTIVRACKRIYRLLAITGYARVDLRLTPDNQVVFLEANPNPILATDEDFAQSAIQAGLTYPALLERIIYLGKTADRG